MPLALPVVREPLHTRLPRREDFGRGNRLWETPRTLTDTLHWISGELRLERT